MIAAFGSQFISSGLSFLITVVLARRLDSETFGQFSTLWISLTFAAGMQVSLVISPMFAIGPRIPLTRKNAYLGSALAYQILLLGILSVVFSAVVYFFIGLFPGHGYLSILAPVIAALCSTQLQFFLSRFLFMSRSAPIAMVADLTRYSVTLLAILSLPIQGQHAVEKILWIAAAGAAIGAVVAATIGRLSVQWNRRVFRWSLRHHGDLGRWLLPATLFQWVTANLVLIAVAPLLGATMVGVLRVCQVLLQAITTLTEALENIIPSIAARYHHVAGDGAAVAFLRNVTLWAGAAGIALVVVVSVAPSWWLQHLYGEAYAGYGYVLVGMGIVAVFNLFSYFLHVRCRTFLDTKSIFVANLWAATWTLLGVFPLISYGGITGAIIVMGVAGVVRYLMLLRSVRATERQW